MTKLFLIWKLLASRHYIVITIKKDGIYSFSCEAKQSHKEALDEEWNNTQEAYTAVSQVKDFLNNDQL